VRLTTRATLTSRRCWSDVDDTATAALWRLLGIYGQSFAQPDDDVRGDPQFRKILDLPETSTAQSFAHDSFR
jgi:hypothetical protein